MKRNWMKKLTMMIMILALVLGLIVCAQAELNSGEIYHMSESVSVSVGEDEFPSNKAMVEGYLNQVFYGAKCCRKK